MGQIFALAPILMGLLLVNVLRPPFRTLLAKLGWWRWLMRMRLAWKKIQKMRMRLAWKKIQKTLDTYKITSKWDPKHWECGQTKYNGLDSQIHAITGNCRLGNGQDRHSLGELIALPRGSTYHMTVGCIEPPIPRTLYPPLCRGGTLQSPLSRFYDMHGVGCPCAEQPHQNSDE